MTPWAEQLPAMAARGMTAKHVARVVGRSPDYIYKVASSMGVTFRRDWKGDVLALLASEPMTQTTLASKFGVSKGALRWHLFSLQRAGKIECAFLRREFGTRKAVFWRLVEAGK